MSTNTAHLRADELLRLIDNDATPLERSQFSSHLLSCTRCNEEVGVLRDDAGLFAATLRTAAWEDDLPARPPFADIVNALQQRRTVSGAVPLRRAWYGVPVWARAAAVLLLVAGPVAAIPAWRDWVIQTLTGGRAPTETVAVPQVQVAPPTLSSPVTFTPDGPAFTIRFEAAQPRGELRIRHAAAAEGRLTIENPGNELPIYAASTLRIRNSSASSASYVLELPESVRTITVRVGESAVQVDARDLVAGVVVSLQR